MATPDRIRTRGRWSLVLGAFVVSGLLAAVSWADTIAPDADVVAVGNQASRNLGVVSAGATLTPPVSFELQCGGNQHVDNGGSVTLAYSSSGSTVPSGGSLSATSATIGPIPATWPDDSNTCGASPPSPLQDNGNSTVTITAPTAPGTYTFIPKWNVSAPESSDVTGAGPSVTFTLTVPADATPPVITPSVSGTLGNNGWYTSNVGVSWTVVDNESSISSSSGCGPTTISSDTTGTTLTCTATSAGGTASQSVTIKRDATAPSIGGSAAPAPNANGWNDEDVTVSFTCSDGTSGVATCSSPQTLSTEGAGQSAGGTATDNAGNTASTTVAGVNIDKTAPTATATPTPAANANGWNNTSVTVTFAGGDALSGVDSCSDAVVLSSEGTGQSASGTCTDLAGNVSDTATASGINIDLTAPTASASAAPAPNANGWNNTDVTVTFTGSDALSGLGPCDAPVVLSAEGAGQSASGTCTDRAGNVSNTATASGINIDKTAPAITDLGPTTSPNGNGWYKTDVTNRFQVTDSLSGLDSDCLADFPDDAGDRIQSKTTTGEGSAVTISSDGCGDLAGNTAAAKQSAAFQIDQTAPTASASADPPPNGNGWNNSDVTVTFSGSDGLSGIDTCSAPVTLSSEGSGQSASGTCTDEAGNDSDSATASGINIDKTAPVIADLGPTTSPNVNGWYKTDVVNQFKASDALSGLDAACATAFPDAVSGGQRQDKTTSGQGAAVTVDSSSCTDLAGNAAAAETSGAFQVDKTAPTASANAAPLPNANGWNNTDVTVTFSGTDGLSGIDACSTPVTLSTDGAGQSASGTCTDKAGNDSTTATASSINIDKTKPTLAWTGGPADGSSHYFGFVPPAPTCTASDALSGPDTCVVTGYGASVGPHTMTATAKDKAGNTHTEQRSYTVLGWTLTGFFQPVDMNSVLNTVKSGSTVPLKFRMFAGPTELTDVANVKPLTYTQVNCDASAPQDEIETTATGGTSLRYDGSGAQFIYNWKTPSTPGKCVRVTMATQDGSSLVAFFKLK